MSKDHFLARYGDVANITKSLNDEDWTVRSAAIQNHNANSDHINKALDDEDWYVREAAILHPNATVNHITKALEDEEAHVRHTAKYKLQNLA